MEKNTRGCPISITTITDDRPAMAPSSTAASNQRIPVAAAPSPMG